MNNKLLALLAFFFSIPAVAQEKGMDEKINDIVQPFTAKVTEIVFAKIPLWGGIEVEMVVIWLVFASAFFTLFFKFVNIRGFVQGFRLVRGDYSDPNAPGEVSHFQALATAVSGTVGLGNIAGVAIAVSLGGPGATFWMIICGLIGMSTKFCECTLGVKYRNEYADGTVSGGPMYYLSKGLAERSPSLKVVGKVLAVMFAIFCIGGALGGGNMFQANQAHQMVVTATGGESSIFFNRGWIFGLILAVLVGVVIIGGIKSIARVTEKVVPFMAAIYLLAGIVIILANISAVPAALTSIVVEAFNPSAAAGGFIGVLILGFRRAAFSNEAGIGSAAIAHSAVKTDEPVTEGLVALYEPFIDTVVICTITALVIIISGTYQGAGTVGGVEMTSQAFASVFSWFPYVLTVAVVLFAFSTMLAWSYYGLKSWTYLFGEGKNKEIVFKLIFLAFVVIGSSMTLGSVTDFSDAMIFAMSVPNIIGLYFLAPVVKRELSSYMSRLKSGEIKRFK